MMSGSDLTPSTRPAAISIAASYDGTRAESFLQSVRDGLPETVELIAGGEGSPDEIEGVQQFDNLRALHTWASGRA